jgi:hypothetical protein
MLEHEIKIPASPAAGYRIKIGTDILGELWPQIEADFSSAISTIKIINSHSSIS